MMMVNIILVVMGALILVLATCGVSMYRELERLNSSITKLNEKIEDKTIDVPKLHTKVNDLEAIIASVSERVDELNNATNERLDEVFSDIINVYENIEDDQINFAEINNKIDILEELSEILQNSLDDFKEEMENAGIDPIEALQLYLNKLSDEEIEDDHDIEAQMTCFAEPEERIGFDSVVRLVKERMSRRKRD